MNRQVRTAAGNDFVLDLNDSAINSHFEAKSSYADFILQQINSGIYSELLVGRDLVVVDMGANIGLFSIYAHDVAKSVYSIEPTPSHFDLLTRISKPILNIHPMNIAITPIDGHIPFYVSKTNSTMNNADIKRAGSEEIHVQGVSLQTFIDNLQLERIDFIKCDIEGGEMSVLSNQTIQATSNVVGKWYIEVHSLRGSRLSEQWADFILSKCRLGKFVYSAHMRNLARNREILADRFKMAGYQVKLLGSDTLIAFK